MAPTADEPLPTTGPIPIVSTIATPAIAITPAIPVITPTIPAITPIATAVLASANATTLHITCRPPTGSQDNIPTHAGPSCTADQGEYFDLNVSDDKDEDEAAPSLLQTTTDTTRTDPYATGGRRKRFKAAQDSSHFFKDNKVNNCRVCKLCE